MAISSWPGRERLDRKAAHLLDDFLLLNKERSHDPLADDLV